MEEIFRPRALPPARPDDRFSDGTAVQELWQWAMGDLRMNTTRGHLVEFLIHRAVGAESPIRVEWDSYDVLSPEGTRIEVKTSSPWQSWSQRKRTPISWGLSSAAIRRHWNDERAQDDAVDPRNRLDVWVLARHDCDTPDDYAPYDLDQWMFYVVPHHRILELGQRTVRESTLTKQGLIAVPLGEVAAAVRQAHTENDALRHFSPDTDDGM